MKANLRISQLYWNVSLATFFMRNQAHRHFHEFYKKRDFREEELIEDWAEDYFSDMDGFEEFCYENTAEEIEDAYKEYLGR